MARLFAEMLLLTAYCAKTPRRRQGPGRQEQRLTKERTWNKSDMFMVMSHVYWHAFKAELRKPSSARGCPPAKSKTATISRGCLKSRQSETADGNEPHKTASRLLDYTNWRQYARALRNEAAQRALHQRSKQASLMSSPAGPGQHNRSATPMAETDPHGSLLW